MTAWRHFHLECEMRWWEGRKTYGGLGFRGCPVSELQQELLDSYNYATVMIKRGMWWAHPIRWIVEALYLYVELLRPKDRE